MFGKSSSLPSVFLLTACAAAASPDPVLQANQAMLEFSQTCEDWDDWDKPAPPFRIEGESYYVGTCGIAAILIATDDGHTVIDSGTERGADIVLENIRKLGFDPKSVKILLASHEHYDHVGGMAKLQAATGAPLIFSETGIEVMATGEDSDGDPQAGMHEPMQPVSEGYPWFWGDAPNRIDSFGIVAFETPGHTPGAMTWQWESCDGSKCKTIVYADSLSPASSDEYRFSDHPDYVSKYRESIEAVRGLKCDILLTPHPSASNMIKRAATGTLVGGMTCVEYADGIEERLDARLAQEAKEQ